MCCPKTGLRSCEFGLESWSGGGVCGPVTIAVHGVGESGATRSVRAAILKLFAMHGKSQKFDSAPSRHIPRHESAPVLKTAQCRQTGT